MWKRINHRGGRHLSKAGKETLIKCNIDTAIFTNQNLFGAAFCLRDEHGSFLIAKIMHQQGESKPEVAEAWSFLHVL